MTKQKKGFGTIADIPIGGGYRINRPDKLRNVVPLERLIEFLNVEMSDVEAVRKFCTEYQFIPRDMTNGLRKGFQKERKLIESIAEKVVKNIELSNKDIERINLELQGVHPQIKRLTKKDSNMNNYVLYGDYPEIQTKQKYIQLFYSHDGTVPSIWYDLVMFATYSQKLGSCRNCGRYFLKTNPNRLSCGDTCKNTYNTNRRRAEAKKSNS